MHVIKQISLETPKDLGQIERSRNFSSFASIKVVLATCNSDADLGVGQSFVQVSVPVDGDVVAGHDGVW